jgi:site-specific DNA-methyltransferase (adenine-specific)
MSDLVAKTVPIDAVQVDPRNARKHGRRNLEAIAGSLAMFGQRRALIVIMEIDPRYCDVIVKRWENFTGAKAVLDDGQR